MRYTVKANNRYLYWSSIVNAPVTPFLDIKEWKEWYINEYSENDYIDWLKGNRKSLDIDIALSLYNIQHKKNIKKETFIKKYSNIKNLDLLKITIDKVSPGIYKNNKNNKAEALIVCHHEVTKEFLVIVKINEAFKAFDIYEFLKIYRKVNS
jgi:hypothetical protein